MLLATEAAVTDMDPEPPAIVAATDSVTCGAAEYWLLPAWLAITVHVPVPLVMVYVAPMLLQAPALVKVTPNPELAVAATVN
jgi:hypothetical protein